jgi:hypothetical protein
MHDPQYRVAIAWQNSGYNQPPHTGFYLGTDMDSIPKPNIEYVQDVIPPVVLTKNVTVELQNGIATVLPEDVNNGSYDAFEIDSLILSKTSFDCTNIGANEVTLTVVDENGNRATGTAIVTVVGALPEKPVITVSRTNNTYTGGDANTIFLGYGAQQLTLTATSSGANAYQWAPATGLSATNIAAPEFAPTAAGEYTFAVTATNNYGCTAVSDAVTIKVIDVRCGSNSTKVLICHIKSNNHENEICIDTISVQDHLNHGCTLGDCSMNINRPVTGATENIAVVVNSLNVSPNPLATHARIAFTLAEAGKYTLELRDVQGRLVKTLFAGHGNKLVYQLNASGMAKGVYFVKVVTGIQVMVKRIIIQ